MCASGWYYESQTTDCIGFSVVSGSSTSILRTDWTATWRIKGLLPVIVSHRSPAAQWEKIPGNNPFLLHVTVQSGLQGVKAKVPFPPNSFWTMAEITPTTSLIVETPETSENLTQSSLFTECKLYARIRYCVACYAPLHQQQNGYPNNTKSVQHLQCVYSHTHTHTHTHVALARS